MTNKPDLIYLAAPYTSTVRSDILRRVLEINLAAAHLFSIGLFVFSPISHTHPIKEVSNELPHEFDFWELYDYRMLKACDRLVILTLSGWKYSKGVNAERTFWAMLNSRPEEFMDPITYKITSLPHAT